MTKKLLTDIFNSDFRSGDFHKRFFDRVLTLADLRRVCDVVCAGTVDIGGKTIPGALRIKGKKAAAPFMILAQIHGNEPAGLAGILLAMALAEAGKLENDVIGVIGNPLAAQQYFEAWEKAPKARQETRDAYRCGLDENGALLPDMNRIPVDFMQREPAAAHIKRVQELNHIAHHISGIVDIHSARGNMTCITDHERDGDLKDSPIRSVLTGASSAIAAHASASVKVQTFKTIVVNLANIECEIGIEAGRHESPETPEVAASFTLSLLHTLGLTSVAPLYDEENGVFHRYAVQPRITYADLPQEGMVRGDDSIYMVKACKEIPLLPKRSDRVIVRKKDGSYALQTILQFMVKPAGDLAYATYQYDEMEPVEKGQVVAVAIPSGVALKAPSAFSGIFVSKSKALYDKDPAVGPWPVPADKLAEVKFCYPCEVSEMRIGF